MESPYRLFSVYGVELEYMVVDKDSLDVRPLVDRLFSDHLSEPTISANPGVTIPEILGDVPNDVEFPDITWSNELTAHVLELKTTTPHSDLSILDSHFQQHVTYINQLLSLHNAVLMPTAMHPWMNPSLETKLWPHGYNAVYEAFNRIFDCRGHGWSNLQSTHLNLPFSNEKEFGALHSAIRVVLPLIPAIAASSPIYNGQLSQNLDSRLQFYSANCSKIPSVTGQVIPEPIFSFRDYQEKILDRIYSDVAPFDAEEILREEWVNARGAIARFERGSIEIRIVDIQEYPKADLAIAALLATLLRELIAGRWSDPQMLRGVPLNMLVANLAATMRDAEDAVLEGGVWLKLFGLENTPRIVAKELWSKLISDLQGQLLSFEKNYRVYQQCGTLSKRIVRALNGDISPVSLREVYRELVKCLGQGHPFIK